MQYPEFVQLVEERYFGNVSRGRQAEVLACFTSDAEIVIRHGDLPVRILKGQPGPGESHLSDFWRHVNGNFQASFTEFQHFVDVANQRCAATFTVSLTPKPGSTYQALGRQTLHNCNFFWLRESLIERMVVYYSNPDAAAANIPQANRPTGYPPAGYQG
jgi:hypothetical protein